MTDLDDIVCPHCVRKKKNSFDPEVVILWVIIGLCLVYFWAALGQWAWGRLDKVF